MWSLSQSRYYYSVQSSLLPALKFHGESLFTWIHTHAVLFFYCYKDKGTYNVLVLTSAFETANVEATAGDGISSFNVPTYT